ncbi:hypothetical protein B0H14DRAFT_3069206 [Mycena olivaceomarginata]|nr:hypothetical protein B0H14DRAFT_3069206 [Mycena olivaceomarginata]
MKSEKSAPWIVRKLVGSMTGRIVMSSYESLRACRDVGSGWGDSSPLLLPCIRFRDLAVHTVIAATGGMAVVAAPVISTFGDTILVEMGIHAGFALTADAANDLMPRLDFYRSSVHKDNSLFATVKDYLAVEKGWFSPYLFASSRRPIIPRTMKPDIVFCHGPFLEGDYRVGQTLLAESALVIKLCGEPAPESPEPVAAPKPRHALSIPSLSNLLHSRPSSPSEPQHALTALPPPPQPRRMVILCVGLKRTARCGRRPRAQGRIGAPLVAWDALTLEELGKFGGIVNVFFEYWTCAWTGSASSFSGDPAKPADMDARKALKSALGLLVAAAEVKKEVDKERSGIAMWRIPYAG